MSLRVTILWTINVSYSLLGAGCWRREALILSGKSSGARGGGRVGGTSSLSSESRGGRGGAGSLGGGHIISSSSSI